MGNDQVIEKGLRMGTAMFKALVDGASDGGHITDVDISLAIGAFYLQLVGFLQFSGQDEATITERLKLFDKARRSAIKTAFEEPKAPYVGAV